jgi:diadenosine tetraphosphate (Ap4A) HIT family hydrolase
MKALLARLIGNPRVVHLSPEECVFCQIVSRKHKDSQTIIYEDDTIVIFPDIRPAAVGHYQIVSKKHILNVDTLIENPTKEHYNLGTLSDSF